MEGKRNFNKNNRSDRQSTGSGFARPGNAKNIRKEDRDDHNSSEKPKRSFSSSRDGSFKPDRSKFNSEKDTSPRRNRQDEPNSSDKPRRIFSSRDSSFKPDRSRFNSEKDSRPRRSSQNDPNSLDKPRSNFSSRDKSFKPDRNKFNSDRYSRTKSENKSPIEDSVNSSSTVSTDNKDDRKDFFKSKGPYKKSFRPDRTIPGKPGFSRSNRSLAKKPRTASSGDEIRLNKYIASTGLCSRREADEMIAAGLVHVNGQLVTELGTKVLPTDEVRYNGEKLRKEQMVYLLLNKPKDYVTTSKDPHAKQTVMELIKGACKERVYPVGRLDRNTTGVLIMTNDGDLTRKLTHPSFNRKKTYHVFLDKNLRHDDLIKISEGIELEDGFIKADAINYADPVDKKQIGIEIHSGRNRVVRRIFEKLDYKVVKLDRVYFAGLTKKGLQRGEWRLLTSQEIAMLKMGSFE